MDISAVRSDQTIKNKTMPQAVDFFDETDTRRRLAKVLNELLIQSTDELLKAATDQKGADGIPAGDGSGGGTATGSAGGGGS